jgi:hypothetical protein
LVSIAVRKSKDATSNRINEWVLSSLILHVNISFHTADLFDLLPTFKFLGTNSIRDLASSKTGKKFPSLEISLTMT